MRHKKWMIALYAIVILTVIGLVCYEVFVTKTFDSKQTLRIGLIVIGAILGIAKVFSGAKGKRVLNKKKSYEKAYGNLIGNAFATEPKGKKAFYKTLDDYNEGNYARAIKRLRDLAEEYRCSSEQRTIHMFLGLNYQWADMFEEAAEHYRKSLLIVENAIAYDNLAQCYQKLGKSEAAIEAFRSCLRVDLNYAIGYNNFAQHYMRLGEYEAALPLFRKANELDSGLVPSMVGLAVCCAMLGEDEQYEHYYRMAVANGYNGKKIQNYINSLESGA